ncbi:hypothetical protein CPC08DRAFT_705264 [Agrocybe pediades]|nr:hypothetical protein CPC08DRAFT_705264 [Agrocybe pediades]
MMAEGYKHIPDYDTINTKPNAWMTAYYLMGALCEKAGFYGRQSRLVNIACVFPSKDMQAKATIDHFENGEPFMGMISLCPSPFRLTKFRPTRTQIEIFNEVFGSEPEWYTGVEAPEKGLPQGFKEFDWCRGEV